MSNIVVTFPEGMTYRAALNFTDALMIGNSEDLTEESPEYTFLKDIRDFLAYKVDENENGFLSGAELNDLNAKLERLDMGSISNLDNVPDYRDRLSGLLETGKKGRNCLKYNCVYVANSVPDFPEELKELDTGGFVFTNRNEQKGVQFIIGAESGLMFSRQKIGDKLTDWCSAQGGNVFHVWFEVNELTGELIVHTIPGNAGINFKEENGCLVVEY